MSFTIRNKMLIMFALLTSLVSALGGIWYHMTTQTIRNNTIKFSAEVIRQMNIRMDSYFAEIARLALPLTARNVSADFVDRSDQGVYERLLYSRPITKLFDSAMLGRSDLYGLSIVSDKGIAISSYSNLYAMARFENIVKELDAPGNLEIVGVSRYNDVQLLTMAVKFYSPGTHNWGILMIDARLNNISGISSESQFGDSGFVWVADQHNHYLYYPDEKMVGEPIPAEYAQRLRQGKSEGTVEIVNGRKLLITYGRSDLTKLSFVSEVPVSELNRDLIGLRNVTILIGVTAALVSLIAMLTLSFSLTDSILGLQRMMKQVQSGNLTIQVPQGRKGEIGFLYRSFYSMVEEIKNLIRTVGEFQFREKESELKQLDARMQALQYQINPHFLYNTLEIVNSHAIIENKPVISRIVISLARIFRYSVENHSKTVPLATEMAHIRDYLDIQMERFENLKVDIRIDEELSGQVPTVPMAIQPLLENAFKHGYERHKLEAVFLSITGKQDGPVYSVDIEDRGGGMPHEKMAFYNDLFEGREPDDTNNFRLGLWNVHSRLRLFFGPRYGLSIIRSDEGGTIVRMILPLQPERL